MLPQPSYAQSGSMYFICLLRDELLLHQGMEARWLAMHTEQTQPFVYYEAT